ncbi:MAG: hypothetical protein JO359_07250 [Candidatus Eremiobacteraeota bacterium]|nr:hypothetical protein [Candidatus Eremiobacteraeota bacterium]
MRFGPSRFGLLVAAALLVASPSRGGAQNVPPTPPPPLPGNPTATPAIVLPATAAPTALPTLPVTAAPSPTPAPRRGRRAEPSGSPNPSPTGSAAATPAPPQFTTLDGVWELEMQTRAKTYYSHLTLKQSGAAGSDITGMWLRENKKLPLTGTFDGRLFKFTVTDGAVQYTLSGYVENFSDIVGLITDGKNQTAFTAEHRKREKTF